MTNPVVPKHRRAIKWKGVAQRLEEDCRQLQTTLNTERERIDTLSRVLGDVLIEKGQLDVSRLVWQRAAIALGTVVLVLAGVLLFR